MHLHTQNENPAILIDWFDDFEGANPYRFLSNFYVGAHPIDMLDGAGDVYLTGEHAFAAYKAATRADWNRVLRAKTPGKAKMIGRKIDLRHDWETVKYDVMAAVLAAKFAANRPEAQMLLDTGDALLVEGTHWHDRVWGVAIPKRPSSPQHGRNWLGRLLMAQRATLRSTVGDSMVVDDIDAWTTKFCAPKFLKV